MKAHIGADVKTELTHTFMTTSANVHALNQTHQLLQGKEKVYFGRLWISRSAKKEELKDKTRTLIDIWQSS